MELNDFLTQRRSKILGRWFDLTLETYPADTRRFLKKQKDRFANPVGYTISNALENLYDELLRGGVDPKRISPILDRIIRIRTVQDFSPSQAISFVFLLKKIIREDLERGAANREVSDALLTFESEIDEMALLAFNIYTRCREEIHEIRVNETRNQVSGLLRKANMVSEIPKRNPDL